MSNKTHTHTYPYIHTQTHTFLNKKGQINDWFCEYNVNNIIQLLYDAMCFQMSLGVEN